MAVFSAIASSISIWTPELGLTFLLVNLTDSHPFKEC